MEKLIRMGFDINFKSCDKKDIIHLVNVSKQFYPEHYAHIWQNNDPSYYINLSFTSKAIEEDFKNDNIVYFLVQNSNQILGILKIRNHKSVSNYSKTDALQLEKIYLLKASTGLGIGKKAIEFTKDYAISLHKKIIWLDVMTTSPALHFYQKVGFKTIEHYNLDYPKLKDNYREMQRMILII